MQSRTLPLPADLRWRRLIGLMLFLGLLYAFRHLAPLFICFVLFERTLGFIADFIDRKTSLQRRGATAVTLVGFFALVGLSTYLIVIKLIPLLQIARRDSATYADYLTHNPAFEKVKEHFGEGGENVTATVKSHAMEAFSYATATAHVAVYLGIGMVLAIMYLLERHEIDEWFEQLESTSVTGTLCRWFGYVADSIAVTIRLQGVVALFNAFFTLPIFLVLGLPHPFSLFAMLLITGLMPVVGSFISGAVLCVVAYASKGAWAVGIFVGVTFLLHKIESYVLTPRLAAQHVKLPSLLMIVSLLLFEESLGFVGLFLSFPTLYVATRIRNEWRDQRTDQATSLDTSLDKTTGGSSGELEPEDAAPMPPLELAGPDDPIGTPTDEPALDLATPAGTHS